METWPNHNTDKFRQVDWHAGIFWIPLTTIVAPGISLHASAGDHHMPETEPSRGKSASNQRSVVADGIPVVSRGHECIYVVPHWNIGPVLPIVGVNLLTPFLIVGSSTKCNFAVGSVRCHDGPIAVSLFKSVGLDWSCQDAGPISFYAPTCRVFNSSTVDIGFTWGDIVSSLLCALVDSIFATIVSVLSGGIANGFFDKIFKSEIMALLRSLGIPTRFRGANGQFMSTAEELGNEMVEAAIGPLVEGDIEARFRVFSLDGALTGKDGLASWLGAHLDGNSEFLGY